MVSTQQAGGLQGFFQGSSQDSLVKGSLTAVLRCCLHRGTAAVFTWAVRAAKSFRGC